MKPMLAESADAAQLIDYVRDPAWWIEQKLDGQRLLVVVQNGTVRVLNRAGEPKVTNVPHRILGAFEALDGEWVFDGELLNGTFHVFDMPRALNLVTSASPFEDRRRALEAVFATWRGLTGIRLVDCAKTHDDKLALAKVAQDSRAEGVMAKHVTGVYHPGKRSNRMLKVKFTHDLDAVITALGHEGKDNAVLTLLDVERGEIVEVGRASTIGKRPRPEVGQVWQVRYLYALDPTSPRLYQPRLMRLRTDKGYEECTMDQLTYTSKELIERTRAEM